MSKKYREKRQKDVKTAAVAAEPKRVPRGMVALMVLASGVAGLVYQVLWMKELGILFGNTAQAASATLAAFFVGLGLGSWWWGRKVSLNTRPLRLYAFLEWGIAGSALLFFLILWAFDSIYPSLYASLGGSPWMQGVKLILALLLVFPASFCMGGTVPAIGQVMVREKAKFGRTASWLYGLNTLGAAVGVWAAAFVLMPSFGFNVTYGLTVLLSVAVGVVALKYSKLEDPIDVSKEMDSEENENVVQEGSNSWARVALVGLCFFSGLVVLSLEVVWTRIFAQVHENSVYAFAIVLIVVLIGLAIGAGISSVVSRFVRKPMLALSIMAMIGGGLLVLGPWMIMQVTNDLEPFHTNESWGEHVRRSFKMVIGGVGFIVIALGTVFPFLMKVAERGLKMPGRMLGRLLAINTLGAIVGSLLCGFYLLPHWGMWGTMKWLTAAYLVMAILVPSGFKQAAIICKSAGLLLLVLLFTVLNPTGLPVMGFPDGKRPAKILEVWEETDCTVAVTEKESGHRSIVVNASYSLGSTSAYAEQVYQSRIPLYLFPETESICFIGMGTGMSAGASLDIRFPKVKRVVTCELSGAVVEAAEKWMPAELLGGLFEDERSTILVEDGRHYLKATTEKYDMINADLFLPYRRGAGSLYSLDHYEVVADRLTDDGVFVQWLPLYQLTEYEFGVICKTMLEVFDDVSMWRNNFYPGQEKVALIARKKTTAMPVVPLENKQAMLEAVDGAQLRFATPDNVRVDAESMPFFYAGNVSEAAKLFAEYPINTDDKPVIEYQTPKLFREVAARDKVIWCVGPKITGWIDRILEVCPMKEDPLWEGHPESTQHFIDAGVAFHKAMVNKSLRQEEAARVAWSDFMREWKAAAE